MKYLFNVIVFSTDVVGTTNRHLLTDVEWRYKSALVAAQKEKFSAAREELQKHWKNQFQKQHVRMQCIILVYVHEFTILMKFCDRFYQ